MSRQTHRSSKRSAKDRAGLANYAFKTAFTLTRPDQYQRLEQAFGTARFAYNWALACWEKRRQAGEKNSFQDLRNQLNAVKLAEFPWMREVPKDIPAEAIRDLTVAFKNFFEGTKKKRKARSVGYPRRKRKGKSKFSFRLPADRMRYRTAGDGSTEVYLSSLGWVRLAESFVPKDVVYATVSRHGDRYYISFCMEYVPKKRVRQLTRIHSTGIDLGLLNTLTVANGVKLQGPRSLRCLESDLQRANRRLHRREKGSRNRAKSARKVGRLHQRIANIRRDFVEKTSTALLRRYDVIGVEDLALAGMMKAGRHSKSLADAALGAIGSALQRKSHRFGCLVLAVDRFFPSSKTCRRCGVKNHDLTLSDRTFICSAPGCGHVEDRDIQAARNIQHEALRLLLGATEEATSVEIWSLPSRSSEHGGKSSRRSRKRLARAAAMSNADERHHSNDLVIHD